MRSCPGREGFRDPNQSLSDVARVGIARLNPTLIGNPQSDPESPLAWQKRYFRSVIVNGVINKFGQYDPRRG